MKTRKGWLVKRGKKGTFYAVWEIGGRRFMKSTGQTVAKDAKKELARIMEPFLVENTITTLEHVKSAIESGKSELARIEDERNPPTGIMGAWTAYINTPNRPDTGPATLEKYALQYGRFQDWITTAHPQVKALREVTPEMAGEFVADLAKNGRSPNTINKYLNLLTLVFRVLKKPARLTVNPWEDIQRKTLVTHGRRELTIEELRRVCEAATGELRTLLAIGLYTGLRLGDCATLRWGEVDLVRGRITRIPNKTGRRNPHPVIVPIHPTLRGMLEETQESARRDYVLPETAAVYLNRADNLTDRIQRHFTACGIATHKPGTGVEIKTGEDGKPHKTETGKRAVLEVGFHSLRHSFVSLCRASDVPLSVVEAIVGHSNPAMTRHYTHTGDAAALAAVSSLPSMTGEPVKALPPADPLAAFKAEIRPIVEGMTAKTWKAAKERLTAIMQ